MGWGVDGKVGFGFEVGDRSGIGALVPPQSSGGSSGLSKNCMSVVVIFVIIVLDDARKSDRKNNWNNIGGKGLVLVLTQGCIFGVATASKVCKGPITHHPPPPL